MIKYVIFALLLTNFVAFGFDVEDCGSTSGTLESIEISGCNKDNPKCILKRGSSATLTMGIKPNREITNVTAVVHGIILGVPVAFALPNSNGCKDSGLTCPLAADQTYTYSTTLPVEKKYPKVTVEVKWELKDQDGTDIICSLIPSKIN